MNPNKALWEKGDFTRIAASMRASGEALVAAFRRYYGPTMSAFAAAEKTGRAGDLQRELEALFNSQNKSPSKDSTSIPATFLHVTVARN